MLIRAIIPVALRVWLVVLTIIVVGGLFSFFILQLIATRHFYRLCPVAILATDLLPRHIILFLLDLICLLLFASSGLLLAGQGCELLISLSN